MAAVQAQDAVRSVLWVSGPQRRQDGFDTQTLIAFSVMAANVVNEERKYTTDLSVFCLGFDV